MVLNEKLKMLQNNLLSPGVFTDEFYQTFKGEILSILCNMFQKMEAKTFFLNHFIRPPFS